MSTNTMRFKFVNGDGKFLMRVHIEGGGATATYTEQEQRAITFKSSRLARGLQQFLQAARSPVAIREEEDDPKF